MITIRHLTHVTTIAACLAAAIVAGNASACGNAAVAVAQLPMVTVVAHREAVAQLPMVTVVAKRIAAEPVRVATLPTVTIIAHRTAAPAVVAQLPTVTIVAHRLPAAAPTYAGLVTTKRSVPAHSDV
jgi:hypothetical protein